MGDKGGLGIKLQLDDVPQRETNMTAYEMMLSESQERMLMVLKPEMEAAARAIFVKWDLDFAIVGETIPEDRFLILHGNEVKADIPLSKLSSSAPEYDRPLGADARRRPLGRSAADRRDCRAEGADRQPDLCPQGLGLRTVRQPGRCRHGGDAGLPAGVVRVHGTGKALAFTSDVTPRYVKANPVMGGRQAVAEAFRNLCAVGARPLATTDNLNFGNPEKPEIMGQFVGALQGIGEACRALDMPIVSGNVSLYNETDGQPILPTPTIGAVGILASLDEVIAGTPAEGDLAVVVGETAGHLGQSALLAEAFGIEAGDAPPVDLALERRNGEFIRASRKAIRACTDLGDGGLALAAFEMAEGAGIGVWIDSAETAFLFGEDQARYLVAVPQERLADLQAAAKGRGRASGAGRPVRRRQRHPGHRGRADGGAVGALPRRLCGGAGPVMLRQAGPDDAALIAALWTAPQNALWIEPPEAGEIDSAIADDNAFLWEVGGQVAGFATLMTWVPRSGACRRWRSPGPDRASPCCAPCWPRSSARAAATASALT